MNGINAEILPINYFGWQRRLFRIFGVSFYRNETSRYLICSKVFLVCTICTYAVIELFEVFKALDDMKVLSIAITFTLLHCMGVAKTVLLYRNRVAISETLDTFERGVFAPSFELGGPEETAMIRKCISRVNKQCFPFIAYVHLTSAMGLMDAILQRIKSDDYRNWRFPSGAFSVFDVSASPNYEIALVYQFLANSISFMIIMLCDTLISAIIAHIGVQCDLLRNRIRRMIRNAYTLMLEDGVIDGYQSCQVSVGLLEDDAIDPGRIPWKYLRVILKTTVIHHHSVIELAVRFERQFSYLLLIQFFCTCLTLCFEMFYCTLFSPKELKFVQMTLGASQIAIQILLYCYWGNEVTLKSVSIAEACSETNFVGTDVRFQKGLALIMLRAQRPIVFTAGKIAALSLAVFVTIMRSSYFYYTVLTSTRQ